MYIGNVRTTILFTSTNIVLALVRAKYYYAAARRLRGLAAFVGHSRFRTRSLDLRRYNVAFTL